MAVRGRWLRGVLLRLAFNRPAAILAGFLLTAPAIAMLAIDAPWESAATDGLGLVSGATGAALIFVGISGRRPDWIDN